MMQGKYLSFQGSALEQGIDSRLRLDTFTARMA